jgi:hypothetical protein
MSPASSWNEGRAVVIPLIARNLNKIKESIVRIAVMYGPGEVGVEDRPDLYLRVGPVALVGSRGDRCAAADGP